MNSPALPAETLSGLNDLFTRCFVSAATYVFEADPYGVPEDEALLEGIGCIRDEDRVHATLLANLLRLHGHVPEPGVFPYWHRDLNYLSVPFMTAFVVESLEEDLRRIDCALAATPGDLRTVHATLRTIRVERAARCEALRPLAEQALAREATDYQRAIDVRKAVRQEREAREKAAAEAQRAAAKAAKAAASAAIQAPVDLPDPNEPGISSKEKARRTMMIRRAAKAAEGAQGAPLRALPDPNEPGISSKEKARRTMMIRRAAKAADGAQGAPLRALPDPNEPGISSKEKARRTVMRKRAQKRAAEGEG